MAFSPLRLCLLMVMALFAVSCTYPAAFLAAAPVEPAVSSTCLLAGQDGVH